MSRTGQAGPAQFLHYGDTDNIGDFFCSPRHYFDFECERPTLIVGGGASNNFFCGRARRQGDFLRIAWSIGQSWPFGVEPSLPDRLFKAARRWLTYAKASTRDPLLASSRLPLVPCVSVFNPVTELPIGSNVGVFLNANKDVSGNGSEARERIASAFGSGAFIASNGLLSDDFMASFADAGTIVTNSYHAAYWGLLSGRSVHIIGYSSKFTNLAALFDFPDDAVIRVQRGNEDDLNRAIVQCADREPLRLLNPSAVRTRFRQSNLDFARDLVALGVYASPKRNGADARDPSKLEQP